MSVPRCLILVNRFPLRTKTIGTVRKERPKVQGREHNRIKTYANSNHIGWSDCDCRRKGVPSRRRVHPRTRVGGGARWIQVPALAGTQETMGGAGAQSGVPACGVLQRSPLGGYSLPLSSLFSFGVDGGPSGGTPSAEKGVK